MVCTPKQKNGLCIPRDPLPVIVAGDEPGVFSYLTRAAAFLPCQRRQPCRVAIVLLDNLAQAERRDLPIIHDQAANDDGVTGARRG